MFEARLPQILMPPEYIAGVKAFAFQDGVSFAEYVRRMFHDEILERGASFRESGASFRALSDATGYPLLGGPGL